MSAEPSTTPAVLRRAAEQFGSGEAIVDGTTRLTYSELLGAVQTAGRALMAHGIEPGDRVAIWSPNSHHWVQAALGTHYAGAVLVPINTRYTAYEAREILQRTHARALVVPERFLGADRLADLSALAGAGELPDLQLVIDVPSLDAETSAPESGRTFPGATVLGWASLAEAAAPVSVQAADERARAVGPDDIADILFTSGTTGKSKGVVTAHRQTVGIADAWADCAELVDDDRYLIVNPFFHTFGYKAGIVACLLRGATIVPMAVFDPVVLMRAVSEERITVFPGAPTIYQTILDHPRRGEFDLESLRIAITGAAAVPVPLVERMQSELSFDAVLTAYGQTEAVVVTMCRTDDDPVTVSTTSGRAIPGMEVRIGAAGEILVRGENVMLGYLDDPEATAKTVDEDGWLHTGDVGTLDERGYLDITDRLKDMYICGGFNVYPAEIENALARLDGVAETAVVGVPDERLGEVGRVFVVRRNGQAIDEDTVFGYCKEHLANYKHPRSVRFVESLPRNPSGKVLKNVLREEK